MSQPGWYPDPAGARGQFRYWDGRQWSAQTSPTPSGPAPAGQIDPTRTDSSKKSRGPWLVVAAVVVLGLIAWWLSQGFGARDGATEDPNSSTPSVSAWDETSTPSASSPSQSASTPATVEVPCPEPVTNKGGRVTDTTVEGGGLVAARPDGFQRYGRLLSWLTDSQSVVKPIQPTTWVHMISVGRLPADAGFGTPDQAARGLMGCWATSGRYPGLKSRTQVTAEPVTVDGHPGFWVRTDLAVNDPQAPQIKGGRVDIVVIDTKNPEGFSVFLSAVHLGDDATQAVVDQVRTGLKVTG